DCDPGSRLPGRGALENIAGLRKVVLQSARQVRMAGTGRAYPLVLGRVALGHRQRLLPVIPVLIFQQDGNRRADGLTLPHTRKDVCGVTLDLHPPTAAVSLLSSP